MLELLNRLDTLLLHPTGNPGLADACYFVQGFLKGASRLRLATDALAEIVISLI